MFGCNNGVYIVFAADAVVKAGEQAEKDRIDKEKALEKAKANSLSHYIVNALRGRKAAADTSTDIVNAENDEHDKSDQKEDENK